MSNENLFPSIQLVIEGEKILIDLTAMQFIIITEQVLFAELEE